MERNGHIEHGRLRCKGQESGSEVRPESERDKIEDIRRKKMGHGKAQKEKIWNLRQKERHWSI